MLYNTRKIIYLFDFDGTLCGDNAWYSYIKNTYSVFKNGPYINPHKSNIKWSILSGRLKIDYPIIKIACNLKGLFPDKIYTVEKLFYPFKNIQQAYKWKTSKIKSIIRELNPDILQTRAYYIDADLQCVSIINANKDTYDIMALPVHEFLKGNFNQYQ